MVSSTKISYLRLQQLMYLYLPFNISNYISSANGRNTYNFDCLQFFALFTYFKWLNLVECGKS